jgi:hypothetical protein
MSTFGWGLVLYHSKDDLMILIVSVCSTTSRR